MYVPLSSQMLYMDVQWMQLTPFGHCPSVAFLPVRPHCANARRNWCQDLNRCPFGELEETTRMPWYYVDEDYPARTEI